jgi:hypothetical protein
MLTPGSKKQVAFEDSPTRLSSTAHRKSRATAFSFIAKHFQGEQATPE